MCKQAVEKKAEALFEALVCGWLVSFASKTQTWHTGQHCDMFANLVLVEFVLLIFVLESMHTWDIKRMQVQYLYLSQD